MATKTISITEEAYKRLARLKRENESFSLVIERLASEKRAKLSDFFGILSKEAGDELEKTILEGRKRDIESRKNRIKQIAKDLN